MTEANVLLFPLVYNPWCSSRSGGRLAGWLPSTYIVNSELPMYRRRGGWVAGAAGTLAHALHPIRESSVAELGMMSCVAACKSSPEIGR